MHGLGWWHEQQRLGLYHIYSLFVSFNFSADSHKYIKIWRERCYYDDSKFKANFGNISERFNNDGTPYDFGSIMHYSPTTCATDRSLPVITKPDGSPIVLNKTDTFSSIDIEQINRIYNCDLENLKPEGEYCITIESKCDSEIQAGSKIDLFHNNVKINTIPAGFTNFEHCLPKHWVDVENDIFKLHIDGYPNLSDQNVSLFIGRTAILFR